MKTLLLLSLIQMVFSFHNEVEVCIMQKTRTVPESIKGRGYPVETHYVTTEDGYILSLFRIPQTNRPNRGYWKTSNKKDTPVLLQHGLLSSAGSWTLDIPPKTPAYLFADQGYDVWLGNARGCTYSRNHTKYDPDSDLSFWEFSFDEMGYYDVPAVIDYIRKETKKDQIYYVGHSMGTTMFFVGMDRRPQYNKYIKEMFALGPVATVNYIQTVFKYLAGFSREINFAYKVVSHGEVETHSSLFDKLQHYLCNLMNLQETACTDILFLITGSDWHEFDKSWLEVAMQEMLSGTSIYSITHYAQEYEAGQYQAYDYGYIGNYRRYGSLSPPQYSLKGVTAPVSLIWGDNDYLADPEDVKYLINELPNNVWAKAVKDPKFNHLDFLWAKDMNELVYKEIFERMERH